MERDKVLFRVIQGEVNAFLPEHDTNYGMIMCYASLGGHGEASLEYYRSGRLATPKEYADLKAEMQSMGYKLRPMKRLYYQDLLDQWERSRRIAKGA